MVPVQRIQLPPTLSLSEYTKVIRHKKNLIYTLLNNLSDQPIHSNRIGYFQTKLEHLTKLEERVQHMLRRNCEYISEASFESYSIITEALDRSLQSTVLELKQRLDEKATQYIEVCRRLEEKREKFKKLLQEEHASCEKEKIVLKMELEDQLTLTKTVNHVLEKDGEKKTEETSNVDGASSTQSAETETKLIGTQDSENTSQNGLELSNLAEDLKDLKLPSFSQLQSDTLSKIQKSVKDADEIVRRMNNTIRIIGEKRTREESLLKSPQQNRSVKKLRLY